YPAGTIHFFVNNYAAHTVQAPLPAGQWSYVVGTYDGAALRLYVNGVLVNSQAYSEPIANSSQPFRIGSGQGNYPWKGLLEEDAVYDAAWTAGEGLAHYTAGIPANTPGMAHVVLTADEGGGRTASQAFDLPVLAVLPNRPPVITSPPIHRARLGTTYTYAVQ